MKKKYNLVHAAINRKLKKVYEATDIRSCELRFADCTGAMFLTYAHRHKRRYYLEWPSLLTSFNQTVLACVNCHQVIEKDKELTKREFERLRGPEKINIDTDIEV